MRIHAPDDFNNFPGDEAEIQRIIRESRRMRAEYMNRLVKDACLGLARRLRFHHEAQTGNRRAVH